MEVPYNGLQLLKSLIDLESRDMNFIDEAEAEGWTPQLRKRLVEMGLHLVACAYTSPEKIDEVIEAYDPREDEGENLDDVCFQISNVVVGQAYERLEALVKRTFGPVGV